MSARIERKAPSVAEQEERRSPKALDMQAFIPAALTLLAQRIATTASAAYRPRFGVGVTDWRVLALLAAEPWIVPVRIAESTGLDKAAVSRTLRNLAQRGLVEMRAGEPNQRRVPIALTPEGLKVHDQVVEIAVARQERLLQGFSSQERKLLSRLILRMLAAIEAPEP